MLLDAEKIEGYQESKFIKRQLARIDDFVRRAVSTTEIPFVRNKRGRLIPSAGRLSEFFNEMPLAVKAYRPMAHSLFIQLFFDVVLDKWKDFSWTAKANDLVSDHLFAGDNFNEIVEEIRLKAESASFKEEAKILKKKTRRREKSCLDYIENLYERYSRLAIIRIDLHYHKHEAVSRSIDGISDVERLNRDVATMMNNGRHKPSVFGYKVGHIFKLECGHDRGVHMHCIFFFDGAEVIKHEWRADKIGLYWRNEITGGSGTFENCNKREYRYPAIGVVNHSDTEKRQNMQRLISYICKVEQAVEADEGSMRLLRRGEISTAHSTERRGRRRKAASSVRPA